MRIKQRDIVIVNKLEDLPIDELEIGKQFITFEDSYTETDNVTFNNVLVQKKNNIYLFNKSANVVRGSYYREHFLDNENYYSLYLELDKKLYLLFSQSDLEIPNQAIDFESEDDDDVIFSSIYRKTYLEKNSQLPHSLKINDRTYCQFISFNLNAENAIVFITVYEININRKFLSNYQMVAIINKDKTINTLEDYNYTEIQNMLKKSKMFNDFYFDFLEKIDEAAKYDVVDYLQEKANNSKEGFKNLQSQLLYYDSQELESLFLPIFINEEREFYIYPSSTRNDKIGNCYVGKYKNETHKKIVGMDSLDAELKGDIRIAKAIRNFHFYGKNGVSPHNGLIYKDGVENSNKYKVVYQDYDSIVLTILGGFGWKKEYYFKIKDYYIELNTAYDLEKIVEIDGRIEVMAELTEESKEV